MKVSERIFLIMKEKGITALELSQKTGIAQATISDWNTKKTNPGSDKIMKICKALEVTPEELLQDTI
jgi:transcriptional regulator with XRE-family HTH domain